MKRLFCLIICLVLCLSVLKAEEEDNVYIDEYSDLFGRMNYMGGTYMISSQFEYNGLNYAVVGVAPIQVGIMAPNVKIKMVEPEPFDVPDYTPIYNAEFDRMPGGHASGEIQIWPTFTHTLGLNDYGDKSYGKCIVTRIMTGAFANCTELTGIELPFYLYEIRPGAFYNCTKLEHVYVIQNNIIRSNVVIYPFAFKGCTSLRKVDMSIVKRVNITGGAVFRDCPNLEEIVMKADEEEFRMMTYREVPSLKIVRVITKNPNSHYLLPVGEPPFLPEEYANAKLIVPDGSKELYQAIEPWSNFQHICTESEYSSAESVVVGQEVVNVEGRSASLIDLDSDAEIYEISGRLAATLTAETPEFTAPFPGIYIIRSGSNSQKVVLQ